MTEQLRCPEPSCRRGTWAEEHDVAPPRAKLTSRAAEWGISLLRLGVARRPPAAYVWFRRWQRSGVWARIVTAFQARADAAGLVTWEAGVDSTVVRTSARRRRPPTGR
ncbi:hypothetical protein AB0D04_34460 [Streptomyces sp. NPDC048483]|uniref:hypothetical protein n=1 Tax=Streptomyces sp. NPDC048483 TaxID=3154927 RepID=UPI0034194B35